jgi:hypothetical protein
MKAPKQSGCGDYLRIGISPEIVRHGPVKVGKYLAPGVVHTEKPGGVMKAHTFEMKETIARKCSRSDWPPDGIADPQNAFMSAAPSEKLTSHCLDLPDHVDLLSRTG